MTPSLKELQEFLGSLPASYRNKYGSGTAAAHAGVAIQRGSRPVHAGVIRQGVDRLTLCVVADDSPGLLAFVSAALVLNDLEVIEAEAHTRHASSIRREALHLFDVRRRSGDPEAPLDLTALLTTLTELFEGKRSFDVPEVGEGNDFTETVVRFMETASGEMNTLEVETGDRFGLLLCLARALYEERVQVTSFEASTRGDSVLDRFSIQELDGSPISPARRLELQVAVMGAIEPVTQARRRLKSQSG